jgi:hypothetical protein
MMIVIKKYSNPKRHNNSCNKKRIYITILKGVNLNKNKRKKNPYLNG